MRLAATPEFRLRDVGELGDVDISGAVQSQLGLKSESGKADVEVLIIIISRSRLLIEPGRL